jgi:hypothetical protein
MKYSFIYSLMSVFLSFLCFTLSANAQYIDSQITISNTVHTFVHKMYIEGVPFNEVAKIPADTALPILSAMLNEPREEESLPNIVVTLGMLGDKRAVETLIDFSTRSEKHSKLSRAQAIAKTSAVMSLGYIVNKTGDLEALTFLKEGVDPNVWASRNLKWKSDLYPNITDRNNQLAIMSVLGLGISGHPETQKILRDLKNPAVNSRFDVMRKTLPSIDGVVDEAIKAHAQISRYGLKKYYTK